jgi:uncharacterized cupin superfamily protein
MDRPSSVNADGVFEPFDSARVPVETFTHGRRFGMSFRHLSSFGGGTQVGVAMEVLQPGRQANPAHYHLLEEEHVLVLEGSLTLRLGAREYAMGPGHYVCFPAGQRVGHALINRGDAPCRYLVIGNPRAEDVAVHTDTGRVAVRLLGTAYRGAATMDYWEGEDIDAVP